MKVRFENVGRDRRSWEAELPKMDEVTVYREVRDRKALASRGIDIFWNAAETGGQLIVGFRCVGTFQAV